ncbi:MULTISPECIES: lactoylglutathione lyase [unclassified Psychrobacter]|uniref:lactoylglutathione lyase n=1 Tax=unclassified Psychrobacter TaxID=196806 RepID=UPI00071E7362|nr:MULTISPECIES: lactoylglutathione lyase [unclassified Psychrobacter]OLF37629.1 lactoylglutathione lyase [Psychrobacter sp. Cmf 22.2]
MSHLASNSATDDNKATIAQPTTSVNANGVQSIAAQTSGFTFNHTMLRVKDPAKSLEFYTGVLGMTLLAVKKFPDMEFDLYFLAKLTESERENLPAGSDLEIFAFRQRGILELTHNYGTESKADFSYHDGNSEPQGFGHICFSVPNLDEAIAWFDKNDVEFKKRPEDGSMKNIAFIKDVDGYWIEIVQADLMR